MARDARAMRGDGPFVFAQARNGVGLQTIVDSILAARRDVQDARSPDEALP
jgi:Ni2+-binding GTPase involved in maturation of urease and hydrogenase